MAEAILRHLGGDRFQAFSAGTHPAGYIHALAFDALESLGIPVGELASKSIKDFADTPLDVVITVCDAAAAEPCPVWPGNPIRAHWSLPDPAHYPGTDDERRAFAILVAQRLKTKIDGLIALNPNLQADELRKRLEFLGEI